MFKKVILFFSIAFISVNVKAQFGAPMPTTIHTPYGNVTTYQNTYMPFYFGGGKGVSFKKYNYTVVLKNDYTFTGKGKMHSKKGITYLVLKGKDGEKEFYPADTKEAYIIGDGGIKISGIPSFNDSCWLFKVSEGRINEFAIVPELGTPYISAVQKGNGAPILKITKENIMPLVNDNPKALRKAEKDKLNNALDIYNHGK
ncbi:hypothetical protein [Arachidicoccus ginsenosidimutans]|uniref:hypothetical protein n=1 Tax=Arachidicoccus sp. BS20 TaxID=1850526 RepID=UPI0012E8EA42|nr:hypothetical protein [Arachidicoccus sp. BS20]